MMTNNASIYTDAFYESLLDGTRRSAREIVPFVVQVIRPQSVIDVGCGLGTWLAVFREHGVDDVWGIDGQWVNRKKLEIPDHTFLPMDMTRPFQLDRRFDLVVSLEVAEHLPPECASDFVESISRLGDVVLFSAAIPYQGGYYHVNEQWPEYWAKLFRSHGFAAVDFIRNVIWQNDNVYWWYAQNMLIYLKNERAADYALLDQRACSGMDGPLPLVHPKKYLDLAQAMYGFSTKT
jgi:SAM-dependent methyltransferase